MKLPAHSEGKECSLCIPLAEVARAWFLRDSVTTTRLLSAPINAAVDKIVERSASACFKAAGYVCLREGIPVSSVPIAATLAFGQAARDSAGVPVREHAAGSAAGRSPNVDNFANWLGKLVILITTSA